MARPKSLKLNEGENHYNLKTGKKVLGKLYISLNDNNVSLEIELEEAESIEIQKREKR